MASTTSSPRRPRVRVSMSRNRDPILSVGDPSVPRQEDTDRYGPCAGQPISFVAGMGHSSRYLLAEGPPTRFDLRRSDSSSLRSWPK